MLPVIGKWSDAWKRPRRRTAFFLEALLILTLGASVIPGVSWADPILLIEYVFAHQREFECAPCDFEPLSYFDLTSYGRGSGNPTISLFGYLDGSNGPGGLPIAFGTAANFRFDATNAPGFAAIAARLTDAVNDGFIFSFPGITTNDRAGELAAFGELLTDRTIESIRFVVDERVETSDTSLKYSLYADWQFWGYDAAHPPTAVSEPTTLVLLLTGLLGLVRPGRSRPRPSAPQLRR